MLLQYPYKEKEKKRASSQLIGRDRTLVFSLAWQVEHEN
jgi:hypothetical protein